MKTIRLKSLRIKNFKGIKELDIDFGEGSTVISGYNGVGKTTIGDAYNWLLFNKNVNGNTKFAVRPRDKARNEIHDVITSVECEFCVNEYLQTAADAEIVNEIVFTARKEQIEDMTKTERAAMKPETIAKKKHFYFIDNAPYAENEFSSIISQYLAPDNIFQLISNPLAFFGYDEKTQRKLLFEACGSIENSTVEGWPAVKKVCGAVNTPERTRESLTTELSGLKDRAQRIPERIDELSKLIDNNLDYISARESAKAKYEQIVKEIAVKKDEINGIITKLNKSATAHPSAGLPERPQKPTDNEVIAAQADCENMRRRENQSKEHIARLKEAEKSVSCPKCGEAVPIISNTDAINAELKELGRISAEKEMTDAVLNEEQEKYRNAITEFERAEKAYQNAVLQSEADVKESTKQDATAIERIQSETENLESDRTAVIAEGQAIKSKMEIAAQIDELKKQRSEIDDKMSIAHETLDVVKEFINRKANIEMEQINKRFETVSFALFEMQTNGENKECCKAVMSGITFSDTNFAKKIQAGIEVSSLFASHYKITAPIFVDNKESVFDVPKINAQIIFLKAVDYPDREFHIENVKEK